MRIASTGVCSNESGIESNRIRMPLIVVRTFRSAAASLKAGTTAEVARSGRSVNYSGRADKGSVPALRHSLLSTQDGGSHDSSCHLDRHGRPEVTPQSDVDGRELRRLLALDGNERGRVP